MRHRPLALLFGSVSLLTLAACTGLLGDFEVIDDAGAPPTTTDSGPDPDTSTPDTGPPQDAPTDQTQPPQGLTATFIAAGLNHTCAVKPPGHVYCWGDNSKGQLGSPASLTPGGKSNRPLKVPNFGFGVGSGKPIRAVWVGGTHTCALDDQGALFCWGGNESGQLGIGPPDTGPHDTPARVKGVGTEPTLNGVAGASLGEKHSCAVLSGGNVVCWGRNLDGECGQTPVAAQPNLGPTNVPAPVQQVTRVSAGPKHTCAHSANTGTVWCWGRNQFGELGSDAAANQYVGPSAINFSTTPNFVGAQGNTHICAVAGAPPKVFCFGGNDLGQLGLSGVPSMPTPREVSFAGATTAFDQVHTGGKTTCARPAPGNTGIACWGANDKGQLGQGTKDAVPHNTPAPVAGSGIFQVRELSVGVDYVCAIRREPDASAAGQVFCWGSGFQGKLGVDPAGVNDEPTPKPVISE